MMYLKVSKKMLEAAEEVLNPRVDLSPEELEGLMPYELDEVETQALDNAIYEFIRTFAPLAPRWGTHEWCDLYWNTLDYSRWWGNPTPEGLIQVIFAWISHEKGIVRK